MLHHRHQTTFSGCTYHALYALSGEELLLAHVHDVSEPRFYARIHELGLMAVALYVGEPAPPAFWTRLHEGEQQFLVSIPARRLGEIQHAVALELTPGHWATVSDSRERQLLHFTWDQFLASEYAQPHRVEVIAPAVVEAYPFEDGHGLVVHALARDRPDPFPDLTL
ncbi:hypothetical protein [Deinococcus hopiensis]|uniref:Uncharacterized protein n=1 Tax=Deinococcus hopiensis KR-140 TaxID=695939 RepID=A0A1W1VJ20_9DEIO|nr:hypothetical protein [Deinococcus hopiensis]SMB93326.1 hypothetical protein SAMN00790413_01937 [Deinococcus hopiensis KR-140]